jgi:hypothetical protein
MKFSFYYGKGFQVAVSARFVTGLICLILAIRSPDYVPGLLSLLKRLL